MAIGVHAETTACPKCGAEVTIGEPVCNACGCAFEWESAAEPDAQGEIVACPKCGAEVVIGEPVCSACGCAFEWEEVASADHEETADAGQSGEADDRETAESAPPAGNACPACQEPMAPGAVLCLACGYHTGLGRRFGEEATDAPEVGSAAKALDVVANATGRLFASETGSARLNTVKTRVATVIDAIVDRASTRLRPLMMDIAMTERNRNLARAGVLVALLLLAGLLISGIGALFSGGDGKGTVARTEEASPAPKGPNTAQSRAETAAQQSPEAPPKQYRLIRPEEWSRLAKEFSDASDEEIMREMEDLVPSIRDEITRLYLEAKFRECRSPSAEEATRWFILGRKMSESTTMKVFKREMARLDPAKEWAPEWLTIATQLPVPYGTQILDQFAHHLYRPSSFADFRERVTLLCLTQHEATGTPVVAISPPSVEELETMRSSIVLLRLGRLLCSGVVIARDEEETTVLTQLMGYPLPGGSHTQQTQWRVAVKLDGKRHWVPADSRVRIEDTNNGMRCLLRFPNVGSLPEAGVAALGPWQGKGRITFCPEVSSEPRQLQWDFPMPDEWMVCLASDRPYPGAVSGTMEAPLFSTDGRLVCFSDRPRADQPDWQWALVPAASPKGASFAADDPTRITVEFALFDPANAVTGAVALVTPPATPEEFCRANLAYEKTPGEPALIGTREVPAECGPRRCLVQIGDCPPDGYLFLVQLRLQLGGGTTVYSEPAVVCPTRTFPARRAMWLGGSPPPGSAEPDSPDPNLQPNEAAPQPSAMPVAGHTVAGRGRQYGGIGILDLCLQPEALIPDSSHTHIYAADAGGIRRLSLADFQETALLPRAGKGSLLAGTAGGLAAAAGESAVCLLDPENLTVRHRIALDFTPSQLAGDWNSTLLFASNQQTLCAIDVTKPGVLQTQHASSLTANRTGGPHEPILQIALSPKAERLYVRSALSFLQIPVVAGSGLGEAGGSVALPERMSDTRLPLCVRPDGEYLATGTAVFDLAATPAAVALTTTSSILSMSPVTGHTLSYVRDGTERFRLLDREGVMIACWAPQLPSAPGSVNSGVAGGFFHPDGRHCLVWDGQGATWVDVDPAMGERGSRAEGKEVQR